MNNKLVCDMTSVCTSYLSKEDIEYIQDICNKYENGNLLTSYICQNKFAFDGDHYYNIPFENIKEGDILIADVAELMTMAIRWEYIRIDHIYRDMIFYTILSDNVKKKESVCQKGSLFFSKQIYPCYIVKKEDFEITCDCPLTKIVNSTRDVPSDVRIYDYKIRKEYDY